MKKTWCIIPVLVCVFYSHLWGQPGSLDPTFDIDGKKTVSVTAGSDFGYALAIQPDGKIIVAGCTGLSSTGNLALIRLNMDGSLDSTFSSDGIETRDFNSQLDVINAVAIQPDGKIVVGGYTDNFTDYDFLVARFLSDGQLDLSFGTGGFRRTSFGSGGDYINSLVIQPDGKILAVGHATTATNYDFALARYNSNGTLDNSFGTGGKVTTDIGSNSNVAHGVALQPDGNIVVAGFVLDNLFLGDFALARYTTTGALDNSFSGDGIQTTTIGSGDDIGYALAIQADGKVVVAGNSFNGSNYDFATARYNANGTLDNSFSGDGKQITDIGSTNNIARSTIVQPNGKIIVAGYITNVLDDDFGLVRYTSNGLLDNTFDSDGIVITPVGAQHDNAYALALQPDGKLVLAGTSAFSGTSDFGVTRYYLDEFISTSSIVSNIFYLSPNAVITENVSFTSSGIDFDSTNNFIAEMSDEVGSFISPTVIGSITSDTIAPVPVQIPNSMVNGTGYRIRVRSDNPAFIGLDNGANLQVVQFANNITPAAQQYIGVGVNGTPLGVAATHPTGVTHEWKFKVGASNFNSFVPVETTTGYTPNFLMINDYDIRCYSVNMWNDTVQSGTVTIHVTNADINNIETALVQCFWQNDELWINQLDQKFQYPQLEVFNIWGQMIYSGKISISTNNVIPLYVTSGTYVVRLTEKNLSYIGKFVKP